jgi:DNA-binding response OmpR family regulator
MNLTSFVSVRYSVHPRAVGQLLGCVDSFVVKGRTVSCDDVAMSGPLKILLVDDDRDLLQVLSLALDMHGYKVVCSCDGQEATFKLSNEVFDLIITDLKMPKMDGADFIRFIRRGHTTPIFVMSACVDTFKLKLSELKDQSNVTIFLKPFRPEALIEKIKEIKKAPQKRTVFR